MKYKVGDKVRIKSLDWYNENKDEYGVVLVENGEYMFRDTDTGWCSKIVTIRSVHLSEYYRIKEDGGKYRWTDDMIEGLVEEECPQDFIEKYCKSCGTQRCDRTKEYLNGCPYYNAYVCEKQNNVMEEKTKPEPKFKVGDSAKVLKSGNIYTISKMRFNGKEFVYGLSNSDGNTACWFSEKEIEFPEEDNNDCKKCGLTRFSLRCFFMDYCPHNKQKNSIEIPEDYVIKDENGNVIDAMKIVLEKKKREYPKTYEECAEIIAELTGSDCNPKGCMGYMSTQLTALQKLLICRNAYWKIAGEEMGLGKSWEPDYDSGVNKYGIICMNGVVQKSNPTTNWERHLNKVFDFPTEEMRDAFKDNFDKDLEACKELL